VALRAVRRVITVRTFLELPVPDPDDEGRVFAVVDDPQRQRLDALLRVAELGQLLLQGGLGEGRHAASSAWCAFPALVIPATNPPTRYNYIES